VDDAGDASAPPSTRLPASAAQLRTVAARFGTPAGVTAVAALESAAAELFAAFPDPWLRAFSVKANDVPAVVERLGAMGLAANVVSRGEWAVARRAGFPNHRITLEGIGKSAADLRAAVRAAADGAPLRWLAVESPEELEALAAMAGRAGLGRGERPPLDVLLRLNPAVAPETHAGLGVGHEASKFGMTETELTAAAAVTPEAGPIRIRGVHLHVGSQLGAVDAWRDAVRRGLALFALVAAGRSGMDTFDVGGGFPVGAPGTVPPPGRFAEEAARLLATIPAGRRPARLATEPGRFLVAHSGVIVARVLHARERAGWGRVVVIDAGMTELVRPMLYGAYHRVAALTSLGMPVDPDAPSGTAGSPRPSPARVDGPICESTDTLGTHVLPPLRRGDLVAIADTGAYAASMAMAYNGRSAIPQLLLEADGTLVLGRARGRLAVQ
jgi:diaminopimelate decarboxylase